MIVVQRIVPLELVKEYKGTGQNGDYVIGTWSVKTVLDQRPFIVSAFTDFHNHFTKNVNCEIDCEIQMFSKEWNGKKFNDVSIKSLIGIEIEKESQDLPSSQAPAAVVNNSINIKPGEETDLPF